MAGTKRGGESLEGKFGSGRLSREERIREAFRIYDNEKDKFQVFTERINRQEEWEKYHPGEPYTEEDAYELIDHHGWTPEIEAIINNFRDIYGTSKEDALEDDRSIKNPLEPSDKKAVADLMGMMDGKIWSILGPYMREIGMKANEIDTKKFAAWIDKKYNNPDYKTFWSKTEAKYLNSENLAKSIIDNYNRVQNIAKTNSIDRDAVFWRGNGTHGADMANSPLGTVFRLNDRQLSMSMDNGKASSFAGSWGDFEKNKWMERIYVPKGTNGFFAEAFFDSREYDVMDSNGWAEFVTPENTERVMVDIDPIHKTFTTVVI